MSAITPVLPVTPAAALTPDKPKRRWQMPGLALYRSTHGVQRVMLMIGFVIVVFFILLAIFAPLIAPSQMVGVVDTPGFARQFTPQLAPSAAHWFGTTTQTGYDVMYRIVYGARTALEVIVLAVALSIVIGVTLGVISGFIGTWVDRVLVLIMDALYAFPSLLLAIVIKITVSSGGSGPFIGIFSAAVSITVIFIPEYFRVTRNATIQAKVEPYVDAARVAGANPGRIMFGHILPNVSQSIPVLMTLNASESILTLAGLGFLGLGIEPTAAAEWGYDLNKALSDVLNGIWWTGIFPGVAIVLIVLGVTLIGESLNDVLNPLLRTRGGTTTADEQEVASVIGDAEAPALTEGAEGVTSGNFVEEGKTVRSERSEGAPVLERSVSGARALKSGEAGAPAAERFPDVIPSDPSANDGGAS